jgi:alanine racemase
LSGKVERENERPRGWTTDAERQGPWVEVDLGAVQRNARRYGSRVGVRLLPMVKANGYGLGAVPVARALEALGPWGFGVATLAEAAALRAAGVTRPVVTFLPLVPDDLDRYAALDVRPTIGDPAALAAWIAAGPRPFHLAIDTGMGRSGVRWHDREAMVRVRALLADAPGYEGACTHFHSADSAIEAVEQQWIRFQEALAALGGRPPLVHAANSAGGAWGARYAGSLARPGIVLYGGRAGSLEPEPVARLEARVVAVRPIRRGDPVSYGATFRAPIDGEVVTLGVGYADGLPRSLSGVGRVRLAGEVHPIAGRVTMDMTMAVLPAGRVRPGDRAELFGPGLAIDDQAEAAGTIAYELLAGLGPRVQRHYRGAT